LRNAGFIQNGHKYNQMNAKQGDVVLRFLYKIASKGMIFY